MNPESLPVVGTVFRIGSSDHVFDLFMVIGPILILLIVLLGRNNVTTALATGYVIAFPGYVLLKWVLPYREGNGRR